VVVIVSGQDSALQITEDFGVAGSMYHIHRLPNLLRQIADSIEENKE